MSFDLAGLQEAVAQHGRVARVVIAEVRGSSPREPGAAMLVWSGGQSGTIGGGALEYEAARQAFSRKGATRHALGPELGQCCGGAVTLWTEIWDAAALEALGAPDVIARGPGSRPLAVERVLDRARRQGAAVTPMLVNGWMIEPRRPPRRDLWIWGAGHVGRALVSVLAPLPTLDLTWIDTDRTRFPDTVGQGIRHLVAARPHALMARAPDDAAHLILTYSHALDLELCHAALGQRFAYCGLIGSRSKWARFRTRLAALGHTPQQIDRITCPIGQKSLGKHPHAIAIGVAAEIIALSEAEPVGREDGAWQRHSSASPG